MNNQAPTSTLSVKGDIRNLAPRTPAKKPFVAKGHDAYLKNMQDTGESMSLTLTSNGEEIVGRLVARDKFTITVLQTTGIRRTFYKHAVESFGLLGQVQ